MDQGSPDRFRGASDPTLTCEDGRAEGAVGGSTLIGDGPAAAVPRGSRAHLVDAGAVSCGVRGGSACCLLSPIGLPAGTAVGATALTNGLTGQWPPGPSRVT
ncbi:hypothetical protein EDD91_5169 [Streptomyces sp. KS 21]|nr:hypothetical protein EDD91_5169 [Streptomyces sp. KS 21]